MKVEFSPELLDYLAKKKRRIISIEIAQSDHSDFEVTEIFLRLVSEKMAASLIEKKRYRSVKNEEGEVLFPPYVLEIDPVVRFGLKKWWIFRSITLDGVRL